MDSKRKANGQAISAEGIDDRAAKRQKPDIDLSKGETAETTSHYGIAFVDQVRKTQDKNKRPVATAFFTLPNKRKFPDYYKFIKMPIALDTIQKKLELREFPTLTSLESYFKRMVQNAKDYNEKGSEIYDDAERIRKALSNFMTKQNPAYRTPGYVAYPTPIPQDLLDAVGSDEDAEGESDEDVPSRQPTMGAADKRSSLTPALTEAQDSQQNFSSLTFQQAQEKLVGELLKHTSDDEILTFEPFFNLPNRALRDYYAVIPNPISIKQIQKKVRGVVGRGEATGVSLYKTWKAFEEDVSGIWNNARHYNEDGSDIFMLANDLEMFFATRMKLAKQAVPEPAQHKLKLKVSAGAEAPKITLRMGPKASPADSPAGTPRLSGVDSPLNGVGQRRNPFGGPQVSSSAVPSLGQLDRARSMSGSVASPTPSIPVLVKNEEASKPSPSSLPPTSMFSQSGQNGRPSSSHMNGNPMLPPLSASVPDRESGISRAPIYGSSYSSSGQTQYDAQPAYHTANHSFENKWRQPGKDASDAMITNLKLNTHPGLNLARHFQMNLPPSPTLAQQSITLNFPSSHYFIQIKPYIAAPVFDRQHKLFVTSGSSRLHAVPEFPGNGVDPRNPIFEARLTPGVNRIEIELLAASPKSAPKGANGQDMEMERVTVFINLLRS